MLVVNCGTGPDGLISPSLSINVYSDGGCDYTCSTSLPQSFARGIKHVSVGHTSKVTREKGKPERKGNHSTKAINSYS